MSARLQAPEGSIDPQEKKQSLGAYENAYENPCDPRKRMLLSVTVGNLRRPNSLQPGAHLLESEGLR